MGLLWSSSESRLRFGGDKKIFSDRCTAFVVVVAVVVRLMFEVHVHARVE
jgi:hypothetical protein